MRSPGTDCPRYPADGTRSPIDEIDDMAEHSPQEDYARHEDFSGRARVPSEPAFADHVVRRPNRQIKRYVSVRLAVIFRVIFTRASSRSRDKPPAIATAVSTACWRLRILAGAVTREENKGR